MWTDPIVEIVLKSMSRTLGGLPLTVQRFVGRRIGQLLRLIIPQRYQIAIENLQRAFPNRSERWYHTVARRSFANLGIVMAEILAMPWYSRKQLRQLVYFSNPELIQQAAQQRRGVVLLSAHYGNWELAAFALPLVTSVPVTVVTKPIKHPIVDRLIDQARRRTGNQLVPAGKVGRALPKIIRENRALALLADQSARPQYDFFVPLFNIPTLTYRAPAVFALRFGMPVVVGFCERQENGRYVVQLHRLPTEDLDDDDRSARQLMYRYHQLLEETIRRHPEQWLWQHRRWKHTPSTELVASVTR